ncbi:MAG TPA: peptidoglycan DD-metalloendopeptidase family protein [Nocardioides sp.]|nr:peptidoglycan DD-metalloendopeptidase family protein [Nocardioides sp.]
MRAFPSAARGPALVCLLLVATLGTAAPAARAGERDDLKDRQDQVQAQIEQTQEDAEEASKAVNQAKADLASAEAQLVNAQSAYAGAQAHVADVQAKLQAAQAKDAEMQAALAVAQANLEKARADVVAGQAALDAQQAQVKDTVVEVYQQGSPALMAWTGYLQSQTPADLIRKLEYADTLIEDQNTVFDQLHAAEVALREERARVRDAEDAADEQADLAAQQLANVQRLEAEAETAANAALLAQNEVTLTVAAREQAQRKAERARRHDLEELAKLKKQERKIKQQIIAAAAADQSVGYVGSDDGFLLPPVNGSVTSPFGYRIHPIYGYWGLHDGTDFGVSCGEGMRAAADGKVISRYYSSVYGNRLYLDVGKVNGHNLTVVYNHATSYRVNVGDQVKRGEIVGYVGSTGWSTGCHLHFTVLQDGTAVDPMSYL